MKSSTQPLTVLSPTRHRVTVTCCLPPCALTKKVEAHAEFEPTRDSQKRVGALAILQVALALQLSEQHVERLLGDAEVLPVGDIVPYSEIPSQC